MQVGEFTWTATREKGSLVKLHQLTKLVDASQRAISLKFTFLDFKHNYNQRPFSVVINRRSNFCPVHIILDYLSLRGNEPGPLFRLADGSPVSRAIFIAKLSMAIKYCSLDPSRYKGHTFRIGAAPYAADAGMSDAQKKILLGLASRCSSLPTFYGTFLHQLNCFIDRHFCMHICRA